MSRSRVWPTPTTGIARRNLYQIVRDAGQAGVTTLIATSGLMDPAARLAINLDAEVLFTSLVGKGRP